MQVNISRNIVTIKYQHGSSYNRLEFQGEMSLHMERMGWHFAHTRDTWSMIKQLHICYTLQVWGKYWSISIEQMSMYIVTTSNESLINAQILIIFSYTGFSMLMKPRTLHFLQERSNAHSGLKLKMWPVGTEPMTSVSGSKCMHGHVISP